MKMASQPAGHPIMIAHDQSANSASDDEIRSRTCPNCYLCGASGQSLYEGLRDIWFGSPCAWSFKRCSAEGCGLIWLDPMPLEEDIGKAYENYSTHLPTEPVQSKRRRLHRRAIDLAKSAYVGSRYGYGDAAEQSSRWLLALPIYLSPLHRPELD
ncbi:MAG: hypothetical protein ACREQR_20040, partial [Candidatus Binataceae bacterium]